MDDKLIIEGVEAFRRINKIPNLHVHLPSETLPDGRVVFLCDNYSGKPHESWVNFYVFVEPSDFSSTTQQIDIDAKIPQNKNLDWIIMMRIMYRIWETYKVFYK